MKLFSRFIILLSIMSHKKADEELFSAISRLTGRVYSIAMIAEANPLCG
jgi:hypothetical protein